MAHTIKFGTIAIVGVGLIGASVGLALRRRRLAQRVIGIGRGPSSLRVARGRGAIDQATTDLDRGVADAELVVVCTPVDDIVAVVRRAAAACNHDAIITDAGSTKTQIVAELDGPLAGGARFLGSHPMAGSEQRGPQHARADLLEGRTVIVTPTRATRAADLDKLTRFWTALGAQVVKMNPAQHDRHVAAASHLPHLVASALAAATSPRDLPFVAAGWLDTTRVASGDEQLWTQIVRSNRTHVLKSLDRFETLVASLRDAIANDDERRLRKLLRDGKQRRDAATGRES